MAHLHGGATMSKKGLHNPNDISNEGSRCCDTYRPRLCHALVAPYKEQSLFVNVLHKPKDVWIRIALLFLSPNPVITH